MENNHITILIPTYNSGKFINENLDSLKNQTVSSKILIADGGSSDNTLEIINSYRNDLDISIISKRDSGQSQALNKLIEQTETKYFLWLNSDDYLYPNAIEELLKKIISSKRDYDIITGDHEEILHNSSVKYIYGAPQFSIHMKNGVWRGDFPAIIWNTKRVQSVGGLNENLNYNMDQDLIRRLAQSSHKFKISSHINCSLGVFRHHLDSKTTGKSKSLSTIAEKKYLLQINVSNTKFKISKFIYYILSPRVILKKLFGKSLLINTSKF